ncbi:MAG TPA: tetratricopeptide repeat protein [Phycisphaerales bacterium]|nr:tetratricopeptide repeat protein [Phycisphaerales bacterium]
MRHSNAHKVLGHPSIRGWRVVVSATAMLALAGCAGHGSYTTEHMSAAKEKMAVMKSATEWEMGRQAYLTGDFDKALKAVDQSIALSPKVAKSHVLRGRILMEKSNLEGAIACFNEALTIEKDNVEATFSLGVVNERLLAKDKALEYYRRAAEIDPQNAQYAIATAELLIDLERIAEARTYLEEKHATFSNSAGVKQTLGHIATLEGRHDDAVALFNQARLLAPDDLTLIEDLTRAQVVAAHYGEAEANISRLLTAEANKDRRDLKLLRARCLIEVQRPLEAREIIIKLTQDTQGASDVESWILLGNLSYTLKDSNRTRLSATRIVGLAPDRPEGYLIRGLQQRRDGQLDAAAKSFKDAADRDASGKSLVLLGLTQRDLGQHAQANDSFHQALAKDPTNQDAAQLLGSAIATVPSDG